MTRCRHHLFLNNGVSKEDMFWLKVCQLMMEFPNKGCTRHLSATSATWSSTSLIHVKVCHKISLTKLLMNGESGYVPCKKSKGYHLEHLLNYTCCFHSRQQSNKKTRYALRHFRCCCLKVVYHYPSWFLFNWLNFFLYKSRSWACFHKSLPMKLLAIATVGCLYR